MLLAPPFRRATPDDAAALADLVNIAGEGLPFYLWSRLAGPGESPWDVGRARARRDEGSFSYRNATLYEDQGAIAAGLVGYALPDVPEPIDYASMPALFVPLQELENVAAGSWYVNVLATYPAQRGRGYGTALLDLAERLAAAEGCAGLSLIVADTNRAARRLYERCGYRQAATRPAVKEAWEHPVAAWVLLEKRLTG